MSIDKINSSISPELLKNELTTQIQKEIKTFHERINDPKQAAKRLLKIMEDPKRAGRTDQRQLFYNELKQVITFGGDFANKTINILWKKKLCKDKINKLNKNEKFGFLKNIAFIIGHENEMCEYLLGDFSTKERLTMMNIITLSGTESMYKRKFLIDLITSTEKTGSEPVLKEKINEILEWLPYDYLEGFPRNQIHLANIINNNFKYINTDILLDSFGFNDTGGGAKNGSIIFDTTTTFAQFYKEGELNFDVDYFNKKRPIEIISLICNKIFDPVQDIVLISQLIEKQYTLSEKKKETEKKYKSQILLNMDIPLEKAFELEKSNANNFLPLREYLIEKAGIFGITKLLSDSTNLTFIQNNFREETIQLIIKYRSDADREKLAKILKEVAPGDVEEKKNTYLSTEEYMRQEPDERIIYLNNLPKFHDTSSNERELLVRKLTEYVIVENTPSVQDRLRRQSGVRGNLFHININVNTDDYFDSIMSEYTDQIIEHRKEFFIRLFMTWTKLDKCIGQILEHFSDNKISLYGSDIKLLGSIYRISINSSYQTIETSPENYGFIEKTGKKTFSLLQKEDTDFFKKNPYANSLILRYKQLAHLTNFEIPDIDITPIIKKIDRKQINRHPHINGLKRIIYTIGTKSVYEKNKDYILNSIAPILKFDGLLGLFRFDNNNTFLENKIIESISTFIHTNENTPRIDFKILDSFAEGRRNRIEKTILQGKSQKEIRLTLRDNKKEKFITLCNVLGILVDPRIFMPFVDQSGEHVEKNPKLIIEFLKGLDPNNLEEYTQKFGMNNLNEALQILIYFTSHNNDKIRKIASQKANQIKNPTKRKKVLKEAIHNQDYGGGSMPTNVSGYNNAETKNRIDDMDNDPKFSDQPTLPEQKYAERREKATQLMLEKPTAIYNISEQVKDKENGIEHNTGIEKNAEKYRAFVDRTFKYMNIALDKFLEEYNLPHLTNEIDLYLKTHFQGITIYTQSYQRNKVFHNKTDALGLAIGRVSGNSSIALNIPLILSKVDDYSEGNESINEFDIITDVLLHEFMHILDHSKKKIIENNDGKKEKAEASFKKARIFTHVGDGKGIELHEIFTEIFSTYLEFTGNEKETGPIVKEAMSKGMNMISLLQKMQEGYSDYGLGSDYPSILEMFEKARTTLRLGELFSIYLSGSLQELKDFIDDIYGVTDHREDILPGLSTD